MYKLTCLVSCIIVLCLFLSNPANAELVGWWKFDETAGTVAADSSGNGNDGTVINGSEWVDGWIDGALQLDGVDDYVELPIGGVISTLDECTMAVWVNWSGQGNSWQRIIDFGTGTANYIYVTPSASGFGDAMHVAIVNNNGIWNEFSSSEGELGTGWHHLAVTVSASEAAMAMYLDGELVGSMEETVNSISGLGETTQNWLGKSQYEDPAFDGSVDDFRLYNEVLSDIDLHAIAVTDYQQAWRPMPVDGEVDVALDTKLVWNRGIISDETFELYNEHQVYIGTDFNDVNSATVPTAIVTDANEYTMLFDYDMTYYWRVDEVGDPNNPVKGNVWSFTARNFIVVEDFEDYNDFEPYTVYLAWIDGWENPENGSTAGYPEPAFSRGEHYVETTIVHGGGQSMPVFYDNSAGISEVTRTFNADWTVDDTVTLTLFYYGDASNDIEPMYVALDEDAVVMHDNPRAVLDNYWVRWDIPLQAFADQGVDLTNVVSMSIGMGDKVNPQPGGGIGKVFFDDIRLYRSEAAEIEQPESVDPGTDNLVAYYAFENNVEDSSGNGLHGTIQGNPQYVSGATGYGTAMAFDASFDHVELPIGPVIAEMNDITVSCWVDFSGDGDGSWQRIWDFGVSTAVDTDPNFYMFLTPRWGTEGGMRFAISTGTETNITAPTALPSDWHHVAAVIDSSSMMMRLYLDGRLVVEDETPVLPSDVGETNQNYLARSQFAADDFLLGSIDEFRIYDRALSLGEVRYLAGK
ncbi:MAG: LamG domain-containing protein [Phycisphaerales bacterium]|jgi:hypothetical protein